MPKEMFREGSIYESTTHGLVKYAGVEQHMGLRKLCFVPLKEYSDLFFCTADEVKDHFLFDDIQIQISKLDVKQGDMLVLKSTDRILTHDEAERIKNRIEKFLPPEISTAIIDKEMEFLVVRKAENL